MDEYIERDAAIAALGEAPEVWIESDAEISALHQWEIDKTAIQCISAADVRAVVTCDVCRHYHRQSSSDGQIEYLNFSGCTKGHGGYPGFFCADGTL